MLLLKRAMQGAPGAPIWATTLALAEKWHIPPWEVHRHPGILKWAARQAALDEAREWKRKWDQD